MKYLISFDTDIIGQAQASDWSIDKVLTLGDDITNDLSHLPKVNEHLTIFIPTVFDYSNSLSYEGANLGLRIFMFYLRNNRTDIDIVLMGNETKENFLLHYDYPNLLKIPRVNYIRFNKNIVASYNHVDQTQLKANEYLSYLNNLGLKLPTSFKSTHSLTNEWCLYKWNSFMGFNENSYSLDGILYFDYLITLERLNHEKQKKASEDLKKRIQNLHASRILLIDDKDGWHKFFRMFFSQARNVELRCLGENFNKLKLDEIVTEISSEINEFNPDIIILDFRLMEDRDADIKDSMKQISGYQVLSNVIKGTTDKPKESFGCQVLIFTATSRIENILMLREGNADGFILKEKPENYKNAIKDTVSKLEKSIQRAEFLIPLNEKLNKLLGLISNTNHTDSNVGISAIMTSQFVRQLTQNNDLNVDIIKLKYLN